VIYLLVYIPTYTKGSSIERDVRRQQASSLPTSISSSHGKMTNFEDLPNEILGMIVEDDQLSTDEYLALALTSKRLNAVATPLLYCSFCSYGDESDDDYDTCITKFKQFCTTICENQFYANLVRDVEIPGSLLLEMEFQNLLTCRGLSDWGLHIEKCNEETLLTLSHILKLSDSIPIQLTILNLNGLTSRLIELEVIHFLKCIATTLLNLRSLSLPDFDSGSPGTGEMLEALSSSKSLFRIILRNPTTCSAILPDNQLPSLHEICFVYDWGLEAFLSMISSNKDSIVQGWISMMKRPVICDLRLRFSCPSTYFQHLARYAIEYSARENLENHALLRYLVTSNQDSVHAHFSDLADLTPSERDIVLAVLLQDRPSEFHSCRRLAVSLYSTDIPSLPLPNLLQYLQLAIQGNLSRQFIPTLIAPLQHLQRLDIQFHYHHSGSPDGVASDNAQMITLLGGCTRSPFKLPIFFQSSDFGMAKPVSRYAIIMGPLSVQWKLTASGG